MVERVPAAISPVIVSPLFHLSVGAAGMEDFGSELGAGAAEVAMHRPIQTEANDFIARRSGETDSFRAMAKSDIPVLYAPPLNPPSSRCNSWSSLTFAEFHFCHEA
jgi:hypothetical protein